MGLSARFQFGGSWTFVITLQCKVLSLAFQIYNLKMMCSSTRDCTLLRRLIGAKRVDLTQSSRHAHFSDSVSVDK